MVWARIVAMDMPACVFASAIVGAANAAIAAGPPAAMIGFDAAPVRAATVVRFVLMMISAIPANLETARPIFAPTVPCLAMLAMASPMAPAN